MVVQRGLCQTYLCRTWSETPKTGFLRTRLNCAVNDFRQIPESELIKNVDSDKVDWMKIGVTGVSQDKMSRISRKPVFGVSDQVQHKVVCTTTKDG